MLAVGLSYIAFIMLSYIPSIPNSLNIFIKIGCQILPNAFSVSVEMIIGFLYFILLMWYISFIFLYVLKHPCTPGIDLI